mmetsp:Transcript_219/g.644  ORF Transcript_219/g.644 Transcript_219/m.644 type:complete len:220 (+) Transcript_219:966-1625(+)
MADNWKRSVPSKSSQATWKDRTARACSREEKPRRCVLQRWVEKQWRSGSIASTRTGLTDSTCSTASRRFPLERSGELAILVVGSWATASLRNALSFPLCRLEKNFHTSFGWKATFWRAMGVRAWRACAEDALPLWMRAFRCGLLLREWQWVSCSRMELPSFSRISWEWKTHSATWTSKLRGPRKASLPCKWISNLKGLRPKSWRLRWSERCRRACMSWT